MEQDSFFESRALSDVGSIEWQMETAAIEFAQKKLRKRDVSFEVYRPVDIAKVITFEDHTIRGPYQSVRAIILVGALPDEVLELLVGGPVRSAVPIPQIAKVFESKDHIVDAYRFDWPGEAKVTVLEVRRFA